jgi:hypothetical protein
VAVADKSSDGSLRNPAILAWRPPQNYNQKASLSLGGLTQWALNATRDVVANVTRLLDGLPKNGTRCA